MDSFFDSIVSHRRFKTDDTEAIIQVAQKILGENHEAVEIVRKAAQSNSAEALFTIGTFYQSGQYVTRSEEKAKMWYLKAETSESLYRLAEIEERTCSSLEQVFVHYYRAALSGNMNAMSRLLSSSCPEASYYLGLIYSHRGDYKDALDEMNHASRQGYEPAKDWLTSYNSGGGNKGKDRWTLWAMFHTIGSSHSAKC